MSAIRAWLRRLAGTFHKAPDDAAMEEELRLHVDMIAGQLQRQGLSAKDAAREARLRAGSIAQAMEQRRDQRGLRWVEDIVQDLRYGIRTLRRGPIFSVLTIATLTLAIGANTAIFSLVDPLLFRDLPVRDPGSLVQFTWQYPGDPAKQDPDNAIAKPFNEAIKYVVSHKAFEPEWVNTQVVSGDVPAALRRLKAEDGPDMIVWGSGTLIQTLLRES